MLDEDGFITITDRLSRFAKIGGEMVSHGMVEEALHQAVNAETQVLAVTSIPDEKKGEQLVVLHTLDETTIPDMLGKLSESGLPNLFMALDGSARLSRWGNAGRHPRAFGGSVIDPDNRPKIFQDVAFRCLDGDRERHLLLSCDQPLDIVRGVAD